MNNQVSRWIANHLPQRIVYHALIRAWAYATTGGWSHELATSIAASEVVARWERKQ